MSGDGALMLLAVAALTVWALVTVVLALGRVRRLHRLHIRLDGARAGLDAALCRRAALAGQAGTTVPEPAEPGLGSAREWAENARTRRLAALDRAGLSSELRAELADAERSLVLSRHVHNDAVRDTLGLRSRRLVRWLRLAGTAPLPGYFEIADPLREPDATEGIGRADVRSGGVA